MFVIECIVEKNEYIIKTLKKCLVIAKNYN